MATSAPPQPQVYAPTAKVKKVRAPWVAAAGALIAVAVILGMLAYNSISERALYAVMAQDIGRGETVTRAHITFAAMSVDETAGVPLVPEQYANQLVGLRAVVDLPAGQPLTPALVSEGAVVPDGKAVFGVSLNAGGYPTANLSVGDFLAFATTAKVNSAGDVSVVDVNTGDLNNALIEISRGEVFSISRIGTGYNLFASILVDTDDAGVLSYLSSSNRMWMAQIPSLDAPDITSGASTALLFPVRPDSVDAGEIDTPSSTDGAALPTDGATPMATVPGEAVDMNGDGDVTALVHDDYVLVEGVAFVQIGLSDALRDGQAETFAAAYGASFYVDLDRDGTDDESSAVIPPSVQDTYRQG